jgi:hypothetical protein
VPAPIAREEQGQGVRSESRKHVLAGGDRGVRRRGECRKGECDRAGRSRLQLEERARDWPLIARISVSYGKDCRDEKEREGEKLWPSVGGKIAGANLDSKPSKQGKKERAAKARTCDGEARSSQNTADEDPPSAAGRANPHPLWVAWGLLGGAERPAATEITARPSNSNWSLTQLEALSRISLEARRVTDNLSSHLADNRQAPSRHEAPRERGEL